MYIPSSFAMETTAQMVQFVRNNSFGILFSDIGQPMATHLPFIIEESPGRLPILRGHFAKANPHWRRLWETEVLVVFSGPHSYISPTWYQKCSSSAHMELRSRAYQRTLHYAYGHLGAPHPSGTDDALL